MESNEDNPSEQGIDRKESSPVDAGRRGGLTAWALDRTRMLGIAAKGNQGLMQRLGNNSAVRLHFIRLGEKRWKEGPRKRRTE